MTDRLSDELAIRRVLALYCRAVDRCDGEALESCFWPDATVDYGAYRGAAAPFCASLPDAMRAWAQTHHQIGQSLIEWDGDDAASVETYVIAGHLPGDPAAEEMTYLGRYLDRFERRDDEWRIADRHIVMSWTRHDRVTHDPAHPVTREIAVAARKPDDALYRG